MTDQPLRRRRSASAAALLAACLLAGACGSTATSGDRDRINYMVSHGQYAEAVREAAALTDRNPNDPVAAALHKQASVAYLLEQGRRATLDDRDDEAMDKFVEALAIDPESGHVHVWIEKTNLKLGAVWYERAHALHVDDNLSAALEAYRKALAYDPTLRLAREEAARTLLQINYRGGLSEDYYNEGVRALSEYALYIAWSRFHYAGKYRYGDDKPARRVRETELELAKGRASVASQLEADGLYTAAHNEFRLVLLLDPENAKGKTGLARTGIEAEAARLLSQGRMMVLRGEWARGRKMLDEGRAMTSEQHDAFDVALGEIEEARALATYRKALALEHDFRYPDAIEEYGRLLEIREYYEDARPRMNTLKDYVQQGVRLYAEAQAAETDAERLSKLRQIEVFWPEYRDVRESIEALEKD